MECNREEAIRAKHIAEKNMQFGDFTRAKNIALKSQKLSPDIENISQMLTVCEVLCTAEAKLNGHHDWYGILQVDPTVDESVIKKQYRKLALLLHPDKNKFFGAEAAFKLVGDAHRMLSDRAKRSIYDMKRKMTLPTAGEKQPPRKSKKYSNPMKQAAVSNVHQNSASVPLKEQKRDTACAAQITTFSNHCGLQRNSDTQGQGTSVISPQIKSGNYFSCTDSQGASNRRPVTPQSSTQVGVSSVVDEGSGDKVKESGQMESEIRDEDEAQCKEVKLEKVCERNPVVPSSASPRLKWRINMLLEMSDSDSTDCDAAVSGEMRHDSVGSQGMTGCCYSQRSTQQKHNVSHAEGTNTDDNFKNRIQLKNLTKKSHNDDQINNPSSKNGLEFPTSTSRGKFKSIKRVAIPLEEDLPTGDTVRRKRRKGSGCLKVTHEVGSIPHPAAVQLGPATSLSYPDLEFYDFGKDRNPSCFAVHQIWALYDDLDGMPRRYARISSVSSTGFKVRFTWLEYDPLSLTEIGWSAKELPVGCGNFILGREKTKWISIWSKRNSYRILPKKGEVWAFQRLDYRVERQSRSTPTVQVRIVEVLCDFAVGEGVNVAFLARVKGFFSLFCRGHGGVDTRHIPSSEALRFSHKIPSYRTTGKETEGIPQGFYELDRPSLPRNVEETFPTVNLDEAREYVFKNRNSAIKSENNGIFTSMEVRNVMIGAEKALEGDSHSPVELNGSGEKKHSCHSGTTFCGKGPLEEAQVNVFPYCGGSPAGNGKSPASKSSRPKVVEYHDSEFYNFELERSKGKLKTGQIWAVFYETDGFPKYYALIRGVDLEDFKVRVTWLEACQLSEEERRWSDNSLPIACGRFKLCSGREGNEEYDTAGVFSHLVWPSRVESSQLYDIYPQVNEVWALYKNWNPSWRTPDIERCFKKGEYEVVEVLSSHASVMMVVPLDKVSGFRSVFKPRRNNKFSENIEIPCNEFLRFSHQIPSFRLTEERGGRLRAAGNLILHQCLMASSRRVDSTVS
ncbi:unnamed protein product [Spirodela intermedia]|uniref:J domain-containing protein n=1 Tax=Spirodela intermedia TaxID=51605 RepID=A0A7I8JFZ0_SPIIN|nr:unnamed protein product [Spirodela intermedia]CAA6669066.1 unnamed protein product [Spirodela intermedia]